MQHLCRIQLQIICRRTINADTFPILFNNQLPVHCQIHDMLLHALPAHPQKNHRALLKHFLRKINMAFPRRLLQHIENPATNPEIRIRMNTYPPRNLIGNAEPNPSDILCHLVRIFFNDPVQLRPICIIDFYAHAV